MGDIQLLQVESLFPSTQKMAVLYPSWGSPEFVARCTTLYLWYNTILQLRQTIVLLGNRLQHIANTAIPWPTFRHINELLASPTTSTLDSNASEDDINASNNGGKGYASKHNTPVRFVISEEPLQIEVSPSSNPESSISIQFSNSEGTNVALDLIQPEGTSTVDSPLKTRTQYLPSSGGNDAPNEKRFDQPERSDSSNSLLSPDSSQHTNSTDGGAMGDGLKRSTSTMFLDANPYR